MSDDNFTEDSDGIKNLRKQYETIVKQNQELQDQLVKFQQAERSKAVGDILKAKGLSEKAAHFYDGEDVSEDAVGKWLEDYADVFGVKQSNENNADSDSARRIADATYGSDFVVETPAPGVYAGNPNEIRNLLNTLPADELVKRGFIPDPQSLLG